MMHGPLTDSDAVSQLRHALHANSTVSEPFEIVLYTSNGQFRQASYPLDRGAVEFRRDELRRTSTASNVVDECLLRRRRRILSPVSQRNQPFCYQ